VKGLLERLDEERAQGRTYALGLWMAFIGLSESTLSSTGRSSMKNPFRTYPPESTGARGGRVNTLTIRVAGKLIRLRPRVGAFAKVAWKLNRTTYPSSPAHATGRWQDYQGEIETVFALTPSERRTIAQGIWDRLLGMPEAAALDQSQRTVRPFRLTLEKFQGTKGDPRGAMLQGMIYGYLSADAPDVRLESGKVGAGSSRTGAVGDIDGRSGTTVALTVEVKDIDIVDANFDDQLAGFLRNRVRAPDATAIVVARSFSAGATKRLMLQEVEVLDRETLLRTVRLWDLRKQRLAMRGFMYYLDRIQRHPPMVQRLQNFIADNGLDIG